MSAYSHKETLEHSGSSVWAELCVNPGLSRRPGTLSLLALSQFPARLTRHSDGTDFEGEFVYGDEHGVGNCSSSSGSTRPISA